VGADEALAIGLANRVVDDGQGLLAALEWAQQLAALPQNCLRHDRLSAYEQGGLGLEAALTNEFTHGQATLASGESSAGAKLFALGAGRGGAAV
jgi:enoyl-CoA hydratase